MIWNKLKKAIIPLIVIKLIILVFFVFTSDISISRDINYTNNYEEGFVTDSLFQKKQKLIRIVRNEEEGSISIKLRGRKNARPLIENVNEIPVPIVD